MSDTEDTISLDSEDRQQLLETWVAKHLSNPMPSDDMMVELARVTEMTVEETRERFQRYPALLDGTIEPESRVDYLFLNHHIGIDAQKGEKSALILRLESKFSVPNAPDGVRFIPFFVVPPESLSLASDASDSSHSSNKAMSWASPLTASLLSENSSSSDEDYDAASASLSVPSLFSDFLDLAQDLKRLGSEQPQPKDETPPAKVFGREFEPIVGGKEALLALTEKEGNVSPLTLPPTVHNVLGSLENQGKILASPLRGKVLTPAFVGKVLVDDDESSDDDDESAD